MKNGMTEKEVRKRLYDIFPVLVFEEGLTIMEAVSFGLTYEIGLAPSEAAGFISDLMGKKVRTTDVGSYVARARARLVPIEGEGRWGSTAYWNP